MVSRTPSIDALDSMKSNPLDALAKLTSKRKPAKPAAPAAVPQLNLPLWPDAVRGVPNAVLRGALFTVSKQRAAAQERELIATAAGVEIRYTGSKRLNQVDLDLWEMLLHLVRLQPLGNRIEFSAYALLKELGRGNGGKDRKDLADDMSRLMSASVEVLWTDIGQSRTRHLIRKFDRDEVTHRYTVEFEPLIFDLYENGYTLIDWQRRKALKGNSLAKWLQGFYASHAEPYPYKVETIKTLCGSTMARLQDFRAKLRLALDELVTVGSIRSWTINDDLVKVVNVISKSQGKHLIKKINNTRGT